MHTKPKDIYRILAINLGSTSTKLAIYENAALISEANIDISQSELKRYKTIPDQYDARRKSVDDFLENERVEPGSIDVIAARGCGGGNQQSGAYIIDEAYIKLCRTNNIPHITSLCPILAYDLARRLRVDAYVYDADGVNEREPITLLTGIKTLPCGTGSHTLNAKAVARKAAEAIGKRYEDATAVVCHMGGGVSTSCHFKGRLIDSTYDSFSPERVGGMPGSAMLKFVRLCFSGVYTENEIRNMLMGQGGLVSYLGTSDVREVQKRIGNGDSEAEFIFNGMIFNLAKDIAAISSGVCFDVDVIALTGGLAYSDMLVERLSRRIAKIAPIKRFPGSYEMEALVTGVLRIVRGEEPFHCYGTNVAGSDSERM